MAINLRNTPKKTAIPLSNPIATFQNPVDDFLAPFKQNNDELKQKIATISAGNNNPTTIIPQIKYNPVTDPLVNAGDQSSGAGITLDQPTIKAPQEVAPVDETQSWMYKALSPMEGFLQGGQEVTKDFSKNLQGVGQDISNVSNELGNMIQNKAPGLEQAKHEGRYLSEKQVQEFMNENKDMSEDQVVDAMANLEKEGYFFEGYNDLNNQEQGTSMGGNALGAVAKGVGGIFGMGAEALGGVMEGTQNISEGQTGLGASQIVGQAPNVAMTAINTVAPGAGAAVSSLFSTDTGQAIMEPVMGVSQDITKYGLDNLTNLDPNSEEYKNYMKGVSGILPLAATAGVAKGVGKYAPKLEKVMGVAGEFVKDNAPLVGEKIMNAGEKVGNMAGAAKDYMSKKADFIQSKANDFIDSSIIGIDKSKKAGYQANPYIKDYFQRMVDQTKSAEGIADIKTVTTDFVTELSDKLQPIIKMKEKAMSEDSPIYKQIRESPTQIEAEPILEGFRATLTKNGLGIDQNGQVYRAPGTAAKTINQADIAKINTLYQDIVADSTAQGGKLSVAQTLDARKSASNMAKYDASTTTDGMGVIRSFRSSIDRHAKNSIEGLKEIDKNFVDKLDAFQNATRDLVYKQGDNKGEFISNFNSKIKNLMNDRNSPLRGRLDEIMPDLSTRIEAINQIPELYKSFNRKLLQSRYANGFVGGATGGFLYGLSSGLLGAVAGLVMGGIIGLVAEGGLTKFKEARLKAIVTKLSEPGKARLAAINSKFKKNEALSKADELYLKDLQIRIANALIKENLFPKEGLKMLTGATGKATGAKNFRVNQSTEAGLERPIETIKEGAPVSRPTGTVKTKSAEMYGKEAIDLKEKTVAYEKMVSRLKDDIASNTKSARYGGTGNTQVESSIKGALSSGKIDIPTAFDIIMEIIDDANKSRTDNSYRGKYSYIDAPKLESFLNDLYSSKNLPESFEDLVANTKSQEAPKQGLSAYKMFEEINRMANDRRYNHDNIDAKINEFKKVTGKDPLDVSFTDFSSDGSLKETVAKKSENGSVAVMEKPKTQTAIDTSPDTTKIVKEAPKTTPKEKAPEQMSLATDQSPKPTKGINIPKQKPKAKEEPTVPKKETADMTIDERIQAELDAKQASKEFKDVSERVAGSRKEKALYRKLSMEDYKKVESESAALANDLVTRDRVIQDKYNISADKESGTQAGVAFMKEKLLSSIAKKPETGKEFREAYVNDIPDIYQKIAEATTLDEIRTIANDTFQVMHSRRGVDTLYKQEGKPFAESVFGKRFLDILMKKTDGAKELWNSAEMKNSLTADELKAKRDAHIKELDEQVIKLEKKNAETNWMEEAKRRMPGNLDAFNSITGNKFKPSEYRAQDPKIVKIIADYLEKRANENQSTHKEAMLRAFDKKESNKVREQDWSHLAKETKTPKSLLPKGEETTKNPVLHGDEKITSIYRKGGRDVIADEVSSPEKIKELFGYKSTQFGNYMKDADSIESVRNFVGAMKDLEDITGLNIKKLNEKEGLSIAFGARGSGWGSARYEPNYNIINLTKGKGNGSVAHEFGHFLDFTAGNIHGMKKSGFVDALSNKEPVRSNSDMRFRFMKEEPKQQLTKMEEAMQKVMSVIKGEGTTHTKTVTIKPKGDSIYPRIRDMFNEKGLEETIKYISERNYKDSDRTKIYEYLAKINGSPIEVEMKIKGSRYYNDSSLLGKKYWGSNVELFARAFAAYIQDLGASKSIESNYLVRDNNFEVPSKHGLLQLHPMGQERANINKAIDEFITTLNESIGK